MEILKKSWTAKRFKHIFVKGDFSEHFRTSGQQDFIYSFIYLPIYLYIYICIHYTPIHSLFLYFLRGRGVSNLSSRKVCFLVSFCWPFLVGPGPWSEVHYLSSYNNAFRTMDSKSLRANFRLQSLMEHSTMGLRKVSRYSPKSEACFSLTTRPVQEILMWMDNISRCSQFSWKGCFSFLFSCWGFLQNSWLVNLPPPNVPPSEVGIRIKKKIQRIKKKCKTNNTHQKEN